LTEVTKQGRCQVRSMTESPCPRRAEVEILGIPFRGPCARQQEAYFSIGELTGGKHSLRSKPLAEAFNRMRRERELTGGIIASKRDRGVIDESVEETESRSRPLGFDVSTFSAAESILPDLAFVEPSAPSRQIPRGGGRGSRRFDPRSVRRGLAVQTSMCVQAICRVRHGSAALWPSRGCSAATTTFKAAMRDSTVSLGIGRGIGDRWIVLSGVCGGLTESQRSLLSSPSPAIVRGLTRS
jgi:hypothetical protein